MWISTAPRSESFRSQLPAVESRLGLGGGLGEELQQSNSLARIIFEPNCSATQRWARLSAEGLAIESSLSLHGGFGEEGQEELMRFLALSSCGFKQAAQDAVVLQTFIGARALDDFAHDDHRPQAALGLIVGGRNVRATEAGKEALLLRS